MVKFTHGDLFPVIYSTEIKAPEGKRYGALFSYAPGQVALGDLNSTQSRKLGFCRKIRYQPWNPTDNCLNLLITHEGWYLIFLLLPWGKPSPNSIEPPEIFALGSTASR